VTTADVLEVFPEVFRHVAHVLGEGVGKGLLSGNRIAHSVDELGTEIQFLGVSISHDLVAGLHPHGPGVSHDASEHATSLVD